MVDNKNMYGNAAGKPDWEKPEVYTASRMTKGRVLKTPISIETLNILCGT